VFGLAGLGLTPPRAAVRSGPTGWIHGSVDATPPEWDPVESQARPWIDLWRISQG